MGYTSCTFSTENLLHNVAVIRTISSPAKIIAMVKANAYGHGLRSVSQRLNGIVDALGVSRISEALALRLCNISSPIVLMEGVSTPNELLLAAEHDFHIIFHNLNQIEWLTQASLPRQLTAWVKIYTGMGRLGFLPNETYQALESLSASPNIIQPVGIMSHFACADDPLHPLNDQQKVAFADFVKGYRGPKSICNSAGIFAFTNQHYDWVRPGIALYGASPFMDRSALSLGLRPVMTFRARLIAVCRMKQGASVGYGARYQCPEDMPVGIMSAGYGDGYPRSAQNGANVLVNNVRCPLIGRVSMDMAAIDLRPCPSASIGSEVILWGNGLPVEEVSSTTGHINYEILTSLQNRVRSEWHD